ncbi:isocitrate/isopropylmalate family dehydrogenase [Escherichia coli]
MSAGRDHHLADGDVAFASLNGQVLVCMNRQAAQHGISQAEAADPIARILSLALLLRYSLDADDAACAIERAINRALEEGIRTGDLARGAAAYIPMKWAI